MRAWVPFIVLVGSLAWAQNGLARDGRGDSVRAERADIRRDLERLESRVGDLPRMSPGRARATMDEVVRYLDDVVDEHAERTERHIYDEVDRVAGVDRYRYTAVLREQNRILDEWINDLGRDSRSRHPDTVGFMRRADYIFGLLEAQYEAEERVIFPIYDRTQRDEDRDDYERRRGREVGQAE